MAAFADCNQPNGAGEVGLKIVEFPFQAYHNLRLDSANPAHREAVRAVYALDLPLDANRIQESADATAYWLSPDEWLIRCSDAEAQKISELKQRLDGEHIAATDISSGMTHLRLAGDAVEAVLRQGTAFDLHPGVFASGQCAQTAMAHSNVLFARPGDMENVIDLLVRRSFADHIMAFLQDAAHDYGFSLSRN